MDAEMDIQSDVFPPCFGYTSNKFWMDLLLHTSNMMITKTREYPCELTPQDYLFCYRI
jgi:hypothetical protein